MIFVVRLVLLFFLCILCRLPTSVVADDDCFDLQSEVEMDINHANWCDADEECISVPIRCPFGCEALINKKSHPQALSKVNRYYVRCGKCKQSCSEPIGKLKCENRHCRRVEETQ